MAKNPPANTGDTRDEVSLPGLGRSPGEGHCNPLQYSCLENPMERGIWRAAVHEVTKESGMTEQLNKNKIYSNCHFKIKQNNEQKNGINDIECLLVFAILISFGRVSVQLFCPPIIGLFAFLSLSCVFFYILGINSLSDK